MRTRGEEEALSRSMLLRESGERSLSSRGEEETLAGGFGGLGGGGGGGTVKEK